MKRFVVISATAVVAVLLVWRGIGARGADVPTDEPDSRSVGRGRHRGEYRNGRSSATAATTQSGSTTQPMPRDYSVLINRSMFVRGHIAEAGHAGGRNAATNSAPSTAPSLQRAETALIFNGVTQTASNIDALVEDTATGHVLTVHTGDAVAKGSVGEITLDSLEYISGGKTIKVNIGENFTGGEADLTDLPPTSMPAGGSGASPEDILERLRQKRLLESSGK